MGELLHLLGRAFIDTWIALGERKHAPGESAAALARSLEPKLRPLDLAQSLTGRAPMARALERLSLGLTPELRQGLQRFLQDGLAVWRDNRKADAEELPALLPDVLVYYPPHRWAKIVQAGQLYSTINETEALDWPDERLKDRGGRRGWGHYYPINGHEGAVIGQSTHRNSGVTVYFLAIGAYIAPMGESGLAFPNEPPGK